MNINTLIPKNKKYDEAKVRDNLKIINIEDITLKETECVFKILENEGFERKEYTNNSYHTYSAYTKDSTAIFMNFFQNISELNIAIEENTAYFSYIDNCAEKVVSPQITQIHLEDFGMSYAIRLSDARFIVIDGGWNFKPDADRLFEVLTTGTPDGKPVIAAWIMTHAHIDHYRCFNEFTKWYSSEVTIEKFLFNFPDENKFGGKIFARRPDIKDEYDFENASDCYHIKLMYENIKKYNAEIYTPHTGQVYKIGDATLKFLSTIDDVCYYSESENAASLNFMMELGEQTILWTGDASFSDSRLSSKFGEYIKADILQVPHHGFGSGSFEEQIICYDLISPSVCFLPVSDYNAYTIFCPYREGTRHLFENVNTGELITGDETRTITLPYTPPSYAKNIYKKKLEKGLKSAGSSAWVFSGLNTGNKDDFNFGFLNMTNKEQLVNVALYFDNPLKTVDYITVRLPRFSYNDINIIDETLVELNPKFFSWDSIYMKGIPENEDFAIRFLCDEPIVVSHKKHSSSYNS